MRRNIAQARDLFYFVSISLWTSLTCRPGCNRPALALKHMLNQAETEIIPQKCIITCHEDEHNEL